MFTTGGSPRRRGRLPRRIVPQWLEKGFSACWEKGLSSPVVDGGRVLATTCVPAAKQSCAQREGQGRLHAVRLAGAAHLNTYSRVHDLGSGKPTGPLHLGKQILLPGGEDKSIQESLDPVVNLELQSSYRLRHPSATAFTGGHRPAIPRDRYQAATGF